MISSTQKMLHGSKKTQKHDFLKDFRRLFSVGLFGSNNSPHFWVRPPNFKIKNLRRFWSKNFLVKNIINQKIRLFYIEVVSKFFSQLRKKYIFFAINKTQKIFADLFRNFFESNQRTFWVPNKVTFRKSSKLSRFVCSHSTLQVLEIILAVPQTL